MIKKTMNKSKIHKDNGSKLQKDKKNMKKITKK